ncbi:uncharacterized protein BX664DRAFT_115571 [Halteromyces radiatus]|uniref:uncharacterized protein n=1 Tax=Halteromyces radiatus TaxID=101107 RepID=UPI00221E8F7C|nr:uncharacterized protein BX664DRAFT_115571 [Halteromyces radiatus]KAI8093859.1 hypothetical protein BX664DRAFT_115571 [Halteromyces radiatus]
MNSKLVEVLHDDTHAKNTTEKRFVLRRVSGGSSRHNVRSNHHSDKTLPNVKIQQQSMETQRSYSNTSPLLTPIPVMQLDTEMEMILRRLERALLTYNRKQTVTDSVPPRLQLDPHQPKLAVMRNVNQGVDVYLPHGILRSKPLPPHQTQYVLMANDKKQSAWELVTQRVLNATTNKPTQGDLVSDMDLKTLIQFATQFLESVEKAGYNNNSNSLLPPKDDLQQSASLSSLDELERVSLIIISMKKKIMITHLFL